ncbi:hypothetical protein EDD11_009134 [Mortierella claussenii]|nr:hypothetical protein EDD11_009134 [Mortierella claussenii]
MDVCVDYRANMTQLVQQCGTISAESIGRCQDRMYGLVLTRQEHLYQMSPFAAYALVLQHGQWKETEEEEVEKERKGRDKDQSQAQDLQKSQERDRVGVELDLFVQKRSRWVIDPLAGPGYEVLTASKDSKRELFHRQLDDFQYRCTRFFYGTVTAPKASTRTTTRGVGTLDAEVDEFWSRFETAGWELGHALYHEMTLFRSEQKQEQEQEQEQAQKTERMFLPLTNCTDINVARSFWLRAPETNYTRLNRKTINYQSEQVDGVQNVEAVETKLRTRTGRIPVRKEFERKSPLWWRSMLTYYGMRPNAKMRAHLRRQFLALTTIADAGTGRVASHVVGTPGSDSKSNTTSTLLLSTVNTTSQLNLTVHSKPTSTPTWNTSCIGIYMRARYGPLSSYNNKSTEVIPSQVPSQYSSLLEPYMEHARRYRDQTGVSTIYMMLLDDDYGLETVTEAEKQGLFKEFTIQYQGSERRWSSSERRRVEHGREREGQGNEQGRRRWRQRRQGPSTILGQILEQEQDQERKGLTDMMLMARCEHLIVRDLNSPASRLVVELRYAMTDRKPSVVLVDDEEKIDLFL